MISVDCGWRRMTLFCTILAVTFESSLPYYVLPSARQRLLQRTSFVNKGNYNIRSGILLASKKSVTSDKSRDDKKIPSKNRRPRKTTNKKETAVVGNPQKKRRTKQNSNKPNPPKGQQSQTPKKTRKTDTKKKTVNKAKKKEIIAKAAVEIRKKSQQQKENEQNKERNKKGGGANILDSILNPFEAGRNLRKTVDTALTTLGTGLSSPERRSIYYLDDDRFNEGPYANSPLFTERNPLFDRITGDDYSPEVLVVGAAGEVGRRVVQRLLLDGRFRVRVLVRDLYSKTLNILGTGVTYCQGDLSNIESLEYAVTDVDKIVFCAGPPKLEQRLQQEQEQNVHHESTGQSSNPADNGVLHITKGERTKAQEQQSVLAEKVDFTGLKNLLHAYQNIRVADFGTSQAAKRKLFKFSDRGDDFYLFDIDDDGSSLDFDENDDENSSLNNFDYDYSNGHEDEYKNDEDPYRNKYDNYYDDDNDDFYINGSGNGGSYISEVEEARRPEISTKQEVRWVRNHYGRGVFVGRIPPNDEAAVVSSRLGSSREDPLSSGLDLTNGFGGFICSARGDGKMYEMFIRTDLYETDGIEYVCEFNTTVGYSTSRFAFDNFQPIQRRRKGGGTGINSNGILPPPFEGNDIRQVGFRYRAERNLNRLTGFRYHNMDNRRGGSNEKKNRQRTISTTLGKDDEWSYFYLGLHFIKVYRSPPEPEIVYISDSRVPPIVSDEILQQQQDSKQFVVDMSSSSSPQLPYKNTTKKNGRYSFLSKSQDGDGSNNNSLIIDGRTIDEAYYKYRGEEIIKKSGLGYCIVRVSGYDDNNSNSNNICLTNTNNNGENDNDGDDVILSSPTHASFVSRGDVAQVCVSALLDPNALRKSFYVNKAKRKQTGPPQGNSDKEFLAKEFEKLPIDPL